MTLIDVLQTTLKWWQDEPKQTIPKYWLNEVWESVFNICKMSDTFSCQEHSDAEQWPFPL